MMKKFVMILFLLIFTSFGVFAANCFDSDGGLEYYEKGTTKLEGYTSYNEDECFGSKLTEYYCNNEGGTSSKYYQCPKKCIDGACVDVDVPNYNYIIKEDIGDFNFWYDETNFYEKDDVFYKEDRVSIVGHYKKDDLLLTVQRSRF
jgi:hypothetical protein